MKNKMKTVLLPLMLLLIVCVFCACGKNKTRLDEVGDDGYNVSVRFEANGGEFTTNCYSIVDSYNISGLKTNANGMVELALLSPDNALRGANDTFTAQKAGYFLAGWYERVETVDGEGNPVYTYTNKWDFENGKLAVDPNKDYNVSEPVITLYAVWVPQFEINFFNKDSGELIKNMIIAPEEVNMTIPHMDATTGKMKMYKFPELADSTFVAAYTMVDGQYVKVDGDTLVHHGRVDANGNAVNPSMDVYLEYKAGKYFEIYTAKQLIDNASTNGHYTLMADLDFAGHMWPAAFYNNKTFEGTIEGNGYTISNVTVLQDKTKTATLGMFATVGSNATIKDVTFDKVVFKLQKGFDGTGPASGLLAGEIPSVATIESVVINSGELQITSGIQLRDNQLYFLGLVAGYGSIEGITWTSENESGEIVSNIVAVEVDAEGVAVAEESKIYNLVVDAEGIVTIEKIAS